RLGRAQRADPELSLREGILRARGGAGHRSAHGRTARRRKAARARGGIAPPPAGSFTAMASRRERALTPRALYKAIVLAALLVVAGLLFEQLATLLLLAMMTVIIAIPIASVASLFERRGWPRALGAVIALVAGLVIVGG